jgi:transglutaminase-like putative cysteine protease
MTRISILFCVFLSFNAITQSVKPFGEVSLDEIKIDRCPYDSAAPAMILFDKGEAEMDVVRGSTFKRHVRIKIFKKDAADKWATDVVYYPKEGGFSKFKASTYNLVDGKIIETKLGDDALFKGKYDKYSNQARFSLPQVNEGSIIEYTYIIGSSDLVGPPEWQFQYEIPVLWSEYNTRIPDYFSFRKDLQGFFYPQSQKMGTGEKLSLGNIPAFKEEPSISSADNYISSVRFFIQSIWVPGQAVKEVIKTWGHVAGAVSDSELITQIRGSGYLKDIVNEQTVGLTDPEKKVQALYDFVKKSIAWNEITDVYPDRQFKEVLEKKSGSSSEINGILISLLKKADIEAEPVLLRTRDKGFIKPFLPIPSQFNDVICWVKLGEKTMLIDATHKGLPIQVLPKRCLNGEGFLISKEHFKWVPLISAKSRMSSSCDFLLADDGSLTGKLVVSHDGLYGNSFRTDFNKKGQDTYVKAFSEGKPWEISKSSFENLEDYKNPAKESYELTISEHGQASGSIIYLNPIVYNRLESNPYKLENREYPVDFGSPFDEVYMGKITIPDGYMIEELPKPKIMLLPGNGGKYTFNITTVGNTINVVSQLVISKSAFSIEEYAFLRELYTQIVAKQSEQIVLKKK